MLFLGTEKSSKKGSIELTKKTTGQKVLYSNNSGRYILYKDDMSLKMYDLRTNKKVDLLSKVNYYDFTLDDKKVVMTDLKKNLYYFSLKKKKGYLIDEKVDNVYTHSNSYVLYMKDNSLYVARLNNKKTEISKITDNYVNNFKFNQKGDKVYFLNKDEQFIEYVIKDKKLNVIDEKVRAFYCKEDCDSYYYLTTTDNNTLKYYKDEKSNVIDNNVKEVNYSNDEEDQVVYTKENDTNYEMYYKEKKNDIVKIDNLNDIRDIQIYKSNYIYYINDANELKYAVVSKGQLKENKVLGNNVSGYLYLYKNGCFYVANVNDEQIGTLFTVKKDKVKEVDKEVIFDPLNTVYSDVTFTDGIGYVYLADWEAKTIEGLPDGLQYKVEEEDIDGWTVKSKNEKGTILSSKDIKVEFDNIYILNPNTGDLIIFVVIALMVSVITMFILKKIKFKMYV